MYPCVDIGLRLYYGWGCGSNPVAMGTVRDVSMQLSGGIYGYGYIHGYPHNICGYGCAISYLLQTREYSLLYKIGLRLLDSL